MEETKNKTNFGTTPLGTDLLESELSYPVPPPKVTISHDQLGEIEKVCDLGDFEAWFGVKSNFVFIFYRSRMIGAVNSGLVNGNAQFFIDERGVSLIRKFDRAVIVTLPVIDYYLDFFDDLVGEEEND